MPLAAGAATPGGPGPTAFKMPAADPVPSSPEKGPFLFSYFLGNGDGLHLAASTDGTTFTPIGGRTQMFLKPTVGENLDGTTKDNHLMRDPCIRQGPDGMYRLVWTSGWYQRGFGTASSPDLVHWTPQRFVEAMKAEPEVHNTWAPELFYNDQKGEWMIFWASTIKGKFMETSPAQGGDVAAGVVLNHRIYYTTTKDFETYGETKLLYEPGFNCIDATIAKAADGKYFMVLKDETKAPAAAKNLRTATAASPEGPWTQASAPISPAGDWVEGPSLARVNDAWFIYYDKYTAPQRYGALTSKDFVTWTPVKENFSFPAGARHGTVFPVTAAVIERLTAAAAEASTRPGN
jgi:beta-xylosidase